MLRKTMLAVIAVAAIGLGTTADVSARGGGGGGGAVVAMVEALAAVASMEAVSAAAGLARSASAKLCASSWTKSAFMIRENYTKIRLACVRSLSQR